MPCLNVFHVCIHDKYSWQSVSLSQAMLCLFKFVPLQSHSRFHEIPFWFCLIRVYTWFKFETTSRFYKRIALASHVLIWYIWGSPTASAGPRFEANPPDGITSKIVIYPRGPLGFSPSSYVVLGCLGRLGYHYWEDNPHILKAASDHLQNCL